MADRYVVGGIVFTDVEQAKLAAAEAKRIEALNANINYENPKSVLSLYNKAQANHVFRTPVGVSYMLQLRGYLCEQGIDPDSLAPIEVPEAESAKVQMKAGADATAAAGGNGTEDADADPLGRLSEGHQIKVFEARIEAQKKRAQELKNRIMQQWFIIGALALIIVAMFIISLTGNNPTILNYRSKIINQYSEWEKELTERENALSLKEQAAGAGARLGE
ncbi:MAG: hypothetical protein IK078_06195 [Lachnospiraceae bacterium]|nr:hypothetical protein [Lachnospiraceae bacterium]